MFDSITCLLHRAIQLGDFLTVERLLIPGLNILRDNEDNTALHIAAKYNQAEIIHFLLKRGAALNAINKSFNTSLHVAIMCNASNAVSALMQYTDLLIAEQNKEAKTPLHIACCYGRSDFIDLLLSNRTTKDKIALLNMQDIQGMTPLHYASLQNKHEIISILLKHGASINTINYQNQTALYLAARYGYEPVAQQLLHFGAVAFIDTAANNRGQLVQDIGEPTLTFWSEIAKWRLIFLGLDIAFFTNRGNHKHCSGNFLGAITDYDKAINLSEKMDAWLIYNRANSKKFFGLFCAAIRDYNLAINLEPRCSCFFISRSEVKCIIGEYEEAFEDLRKGLGFNPMNNDEDNSYHESDPQKRPSVVMQQTNNENLTHNSTELTLPVVNLIETPGRPMPKKYKSLYKKLSNLSNTDNAPKSADEIKQQFSFFRYKKHNRKAVSRNLDNKTYQCINNAV
jgi:ankyrin repeat protein